MATASYSSVLAVINQTGIAKHNPALYQSLKSMIDTGNITIAQFNADIAGLIARINNTFMFGTEAERANWKPQATVGNLVFFYATDTGILWVFIASQNDWFPVGAPIDATYLTWTDETARLPNSRQLIAGANIEFDDSTPGERVVSSTGGFIAMCTGDYPPQEMGIGQAIMMIPVTDAT